MDEFATWMNFATWDKFAIWANCGVGEFHHILRCASSRTLPLQRTQTPSYQAHDVFLCVYTHIYTYLHDICQHSDNTHVGANCNSPILWGQFALPLWSIENIGEFATWMNFAIWAIHPSIKGNSPSLVCGRSLPNERNMCKLCPYDRNHKRR